MKLQLANKWKTRGLQPPIAYKPNPDIGKKPEDNQDSLKVEIKIHPGVKCSKTV